MSAFPLKWYRIEVSGDHIHRNTPLRVLDVVRGDGLAVGKFIFQKEEKGIIHGRIQISNFVERYIPDGGYYRIWRNKRLDEALARIYRTA